MKGDRARTPEFDSCRILNTEPKRFSERAHAALHALADVTDVEADREYLLDHVSTFDVLFIALRNTIDSEIMARASRLKCIVTPTTGTNHIDTALACQKGIEVLSLQGETEFLQGVTATAELTWALLLSLIRKVSAAHASVMRGKWQRDEFYGMELKDKVLGIVGYGRLGKMVAEYGRAFRMSVLAFDHRDSPSASSHVGFVNLRELLSRSDVVSIHLPLTRETRGLFDRQKFDSMKDGAVLINTARGEIVDESALVHALKRGKLYGAAIDVMTGETSLDPAWLVASPLLAYGRSNDNLLITPHIGGVTYDSVEATNLFMIGKLATHLRDRSKAVTA